MSEASGEQCRITETEKGDYMIKGNYRRCIARQNEIRQALSETLLRYEWTEGE